MQITSLQPGPIFPSPFQSPKPSPQSTSAQNPMQNVKEGQAVPSEPTQASAEASEQATGKAALEKPEEVSKGMRPELNFKDLKIVQDLKKRDREVRVHEAAHLGAAGPYASGGPSYTYKRGPDGRQYAVGGEVQIDIAEVSGDPAATLQKAHVIRRAANAPANPSSQDRRVAAQAAAMEAEALQELTELRLEEKSNAGKVSEAKESEAGDPSRSANDGTEESHSQELKATDKNKKTALYPNISFSDRQIKTVGQLLDLSA